MKTVTKEQIEKALSNNCMKEDILNELFPPEFKAGDWVVVTSKGTTESKELYGKTVQLKSTTNDTVTTKDPDNPHGMFFKEVRHATLEEIEAVNWKEGELYRVKTGDVWLVRVSTGTVAHFYNNGAYRGVLSKYDTYEKINICRCGFCVKEKEG